MEDSNSTNDQLPQWHDPLLLTDVQQQQEEEDNTSSLSYSSNTEPISSKFQTLAMVDSNSNEDTCWQESQSVESITMKKLLDRVENDAVDGRSMLGFSLTSPDLVICAGSPDLSRNGYRDSPELLDGKFSIELSLENGIDGSDMKDSIKTPCVKFSSVFQTFNKELSPESSFELLPHQEKEEKLVKELVPGVCINAGCTDRAVVLGGVEFLGDDCFLLSPSRSPYVPHTFPLKQKKNPPNLSNTHCSSKPRFSACLLIAYLMADVDQGIGEQEVDHAAVHGVDPATDFADHPVAHGLESTDLGLDHGTDHAVDDGVDHSTGPGLAGEHDDMDHLTDHDVDHPVNHDVDHPVNHEMDNAEDQVPENNEASKQGHDEDTVSGGAEKRWPGWPGESVFRMLVPAQKVGSIIGRKGEFIKKIVEETRARIKILDGPPGTSERAVMVSAKEEPDSSLPPAMDGLLRVHKRIIDGLDSDSSNALPSSGAKVSTRLLVPASQAGSLIGKQGGTVKSIQEASTCIVRVLGAEDLPVFALQDDRVVEVLGEAAGVHKAVELIASHLRKFLVDRSIIPLFEMQMQMSNPSMEQMPPHQSWGPPQPLPPNPVGGPGYGQNPQYMPPPRQLDSYYPADMPPPMEKQPHQGISAYGREPMGGHASSNAQAAPSMITQITQQMQIPLSYADAVIGTAGASISYIRRASGATVTIQETRGVPGAMTVEISGTASQVQTAQQLIQNFMAEAGAPAQPQPGGGADQGYNPYSHSYASPPSNPEHAGHAGGYGSMYGANYGY